MNRHEHHTADMLAYEQRMRDVPLGAAAQRCPKCGNLAHGLWPVDANDFHAGETTPVRYLCGRCVEVGGP